MFQACQKKLYIHSQGSNVLKHLVFYNDSFYLPILHFISNKMHYVLEITLPATIPKGSAQLSSPNITYVVSQEDVILFFNMPPHTYRFSS